MSTTKRYTVVTACGDEYGYADLPAAAENAARVAERTREHVVVVDEETGADVYVAVAT